MLHDFNFQFKMLNAVYCMYFQKIKITKAFTVVTGIGMV